MVGGGYVISSVFTQIIIFMGHEEEGEGITIQIAFRACTRKICVIIR